MYIRKLHGYRRLNSGGYNFVSIMKYAEYLNFITNCNCSFLFVEKIDKNVRESLVVFQFSILYIFSETSLSLSLS